MMKRYQKIIELFQKDFPSANLLVRSKGKHFTCPNQDNCMANAKSDPIWTPLFGIPNTKVMLIAEAPSTSGGKGLHISGQITKDNKKEFFNASLLSFVEKYYNTIPYFTDVMKCGLKKQTNKNKSKYFNKRKKYCSKRFLFKEIEILNPDTILCIGNTAFETIKDHPSTKNCEIIQLVHYSNQANLPITNSDKEEIIWPFQVGKINYEKLKELSFFKRRIRK